MSVFNKVFANNRKLALFIAIVTLLASFFIGFYFYYVPSNKENSNNYAFLILENIITRINRNTASTKDVYSNYVKQYTPDKLNTELKKAGMEGRMPESKRWTDFIARGMDKRIAGSNLRADSMGNLMQTDNAIDSNKSVLTGINSEQFLFSYHAHQSDILVAAPVKNTLRASFDMHKKEIFNSFLLLNMIRDTGHIVYKDPDLLMEDNILMDSLVPASKGKFVAGTRDIQLEGLTYKMFYAPFNIDDQRMLVCGFVLTNEYESKLHRIPASYIFPFVILFLFLLISLPILKFYIMGPEEEIKFSGIILFFLSLFVGGSVITIVAIQVILLKDGNIRAQNDLANLSAQIRSGFSNEIYKAYDQLNVLDSIVDNNRRVTHRFPHNVSDTIQKYIEDHRNDSTSYLGLKRVSWINREGQQFIKGEVHDSISATSKDNPLYIDVSKRAYYSNFNNGTPYPLPGSDSVFMFEPVYNWNDGEFNTVVSKRSRMDSAFLTTLVIPGYSLTNTILPPGYGFCIINENGDVQYHSDSTRNLMENFIEQLSSPNPIYEAIAARQQAFLPDASFYGKDYCLYIRPLKKMPLYIVTFYDKGYIVPINMRILIFSVVFCIISFITYVTILFFFFRKKYSVNEVLYSPRHYLYYLFPRRRLAFVYVRINLLLLLYMIMMGILVFFLKYCSIHLNHVVLILLLFTPLNIGVGLLVMFNRGREPGLSKRGLAVLAITSALVIIAAVLISGEVHFHFLVFQLVYISGLLVYSRRLLPLGFRGMRWGLQHYIFLHSFLSVVFVLCLSVLPAGLFTWYSHNQEIIQSVKKEQLSLAKQIDNRSIVHLPAFLKPTMYYHDLLYNAGIYSIYGDTLSVQNSHVITDGQPTFDDFYFNLSNLVSNNYYDRQVFPALKDSSTDNLWSWKFRTLETLSLSYKLSHRTASDSLQKNDNVLEINSAIPERYIYLKAGSRGLLLLLFCIVLLYGLYKLFKTIIGRVSLRKYILNYDGDDSASLEKMITAYRATVTLDPVKEAATRSILQEHTQFVFSNDSDLIIDQEKRIILLAEAHKDFYSFVWNSCSDSEKFLLYNFAKEGLMNYKNRVEIYRLLERGLLKTIHKDRDLAFFSRSFRAYLIEYLPDDEIAAMRKKFNENSTWQSFRIPFLLILLGTASFLFFTQQDTWQRLMALIAGFGSTLPLLMNVFSRGTPKSA